MIRALIHPERCINCDPCPVQRACDRQAIIRESPGEKPWVDFYRCAGCLKCKTVCPAGAIEQISQPCTGRGRMGW